MKSCLIVDDSRVVRKVARRILEDLHFAIEEAADGKLALDACLKSMPDVVLLDWNMPVMNGIDFLRQLRRAPGGESPVVVFCTTENDLQLGTRRSRQRGMDGCAVGRFVGTRRHGRRRLRDRARGSGSRNTRGTAHTARADFVRPEFAATKSNSAGSIDRLSDEWL
jgi:two-component system chemotaxis response regulator CheY